MTQPAASSSSLPLTVDALAAQLVLLYTTAEQQLMSRFATLVDTTPTGALLGVMRREAIRVASELRNQTGPLTRQIALTAARRGDQAAFDQLRRIVETSEPIRAVVGTDSIAARAAADLETRLAATLPRLQRFADDAWRAVNIDNALADLVHPRYTQAVAQRIAWRRLVERGITGFTDRAGRRWNLASYVEMATRTAVQETFNAAHLQRMVAAGIDKFIVPSDGHPCPLCKPWQGQVLTVSGPSPTIAEARAAGLWHPNCRHTLVAYIPRVSKFAAPTGWTDADQARYDATQRLRALERQVRAHKRVASAALDQMQKQRALRQVRATQARIREHVQRHGLNRRSWREQLDLGNR